MQKMTINFDGDREMIEEFLFWFETYGESEYNQHFWRQDRCPKISRFYVDPEKGIIYGETGAE